MVTAESRRYQVVLCVNEVSEEAARLITLHGGKVIVINSEPHIVAVMLPQGARLEQGDPEKVIEWRLVLPNGLPLDYLRSANVLVSWIRETRHY